MLGMGCVILLWHSLGLSYNYFGDLGAFMGYIDSSDNRACFRSNSEFTETVEMCKRGINIGVSQTEYSIMQVRNNGLYAGTVKKVSDYQELAQSEPKLQVDITHTVQRHHTVNQMNSSYPKDDHTAF